jgi:outer membrane protein assembly factor BamB
VTPLKHYRVTLLLWLVTVSGTTADDWPEFRGPTGQGRAVGNYPTTWSTTENVAWKQAIPGRGWSSPIVWKGRVYLTTATPGLGDMVDQSLRALCLNAASGQILWDREVFAQAGRGAPKLHRKNGHASPTPLTDGERLYVHFGHQGTAALDMGGNTVWQRRDLIYLPRYGNGGSPALVDGMLIVCCDGEDQQFVIALDAKTGVTRWKTDRGIKQDDPYSFATPLAIEVSGRREVVCPAAGANMSYDPATGRELWRFALNAECFSNVPRPLFAHGLIFLSDAGEPPDLLAIRAGGTGEISATHLAWRAKNVLGLTASPVLVGDELYTVTDQGVGVCLDARTGKVHWRNRIGGDFSASLLFAGGHLYFQNEDGVATVIRPGIKYELVATNDLKEPTLASYAAADGAFFIRTEQHLFRIEKRP